MVLNPLRETAAATAAIEQANHALGSVASEDIPAWAFAATRDNTIGTTNTCFMVQRAAPYARSK
jgi:hypothetical protein